MEVAEAKGLIVEEAVVLLQNQKGKEGGDNLAF